MSYHFMLPFYIKKKNETLRPTRFNIPKKMMQHGKTTVMVICKIFLIYESKKDNTKVNNNKLTEASLRPESDLLASSRSMHQHHINMQSRVSQAKINQ